jgi:hypothetical protein
MRIWQVSAAVVLLAAASACASAPPPERLQLALSPAGFGQSLQLRQQVNVDSPARSISLDAVLDIAPESVTLVGMAYGQRVLTIRFDGTALTEERHPLVPDDVRAADILTDMQIALWPEAVVRAALPAGWGLAEGASSRTLLRDGTSAVEIAYDANPRWLGIIRIHHLAYGYRLEIRPARERS